MTPSVTIFGATGYTGRLCARALIESGLQVRLAGRRQDALASLARDLGGDVEIAVADAGDHDALHALAEAADVLVSTVGPYDEPVPGAPAGRGRGVVEAALAAGTDYLDVSGEVGFLDWAYDQGARAAEAGVVLCPGFGVDGAPGELLAALAADEIAMAVRDVRIGYLVRGALPTAGTARTMVDMAERGGLALVGGRLVEEPPFAEVWDLPFPAPLSARPGVSVPTGEIAMVGRSLGATGARSYMAVADLPGATGVASVTGRVIERLAETPLMDLARRMAAHLPEGPSEEQRAAAKFAVIAEVSGARGVARAWGRFTDTYGTTAAIVVAAAHRLLKGGIEPGARTPSQVAGEPGGFLDEIGVRWERLPA